MTDQDILAILTSAEAGEFCTIAELAGRCGTPRREIEAAVERLRLAGEPIVAGPDGIRYTTDVGEIRAYAKGRRSRLASIARGTRELLKTARRLDTTQPSLWG